MKRLFNQYFPQVEQYRLHMVQSSLQSHCLSFDSRPRIEIPRGSQHRSKNVLLFSLKMKFTVVDFTIFDIL